MLKRFSAGVVALGLSLMAAAPSYAIPFSTSAAGGTVSVPGDYATLKLAADAFNALAGGIQGNWTVQITAPTLTESANMSWGNATNGNSLTIKPAAGVSPVVTFQNTVGDNAGASGHIVFGTTNLTSADAVVDMSNITIDGSNNGTSSKNLTITQQAPALVGNYANSRILRFFGNVDNVVVKNSILTMASNNGLSAFPIDVTARRTTGGADKIPDTYTIENNTLTCLTGNGMQGIQVGVSGTISTGEASTGITITNNIINARTRGVFLNGLKTGTISKNTIKINMTGTGSTSHGIYVFSSNTSNYTLDIIGNTIDQLQTANAAAANGIRALSLEAGSLTNGGSTVNIQNNIISGFAFTTGVAAVDQQCVVFRNTVNGVNYNILNNSINFSPTGAQVPTGVTAGNVSVLNLTTAGYAGQAVFKNNIVRVGATNGYALLNAKTGGGNLTSDFNNISLSGAAGQQFGRSAATNHATLASWKTATGQDYGSSTGNPVTNATNQWASATNLHWASAVLPTGINAGTPLAAVTDDIDNQPRNASSPYMGADELPAVAYPATPVVTLGAPSTVGPINSTGTIDYTVTYTGADSVTLSASDVIINKTGTADATAAVTGTGPYTVTLSSITGTGTLGISLRSATASNGGQSFAAGAGPSATTVVDNTAPVSSGTVTDTTVNGSSISVNFTATDAGGAGVANTKLYVKAPGDVSFSDTLLSLTGASGTFNYTAGVDGSYEFYTIATDNVNNVELAPVTADVTVILDNAAPSSSATVTDNTVNGVSIQVNFTASDSGLAGVLSTKLFAKGPSDVGFVDTGQTLTGASGQFGYAAAQGDGVYEFYTIATDNSSNAEAAPGTGDVAVTLDNVAPLSSATVIDNTQVNSSILVDFTAGDAAGSGVATTKLFVKGPGAGVFTDSGLSNAGASGSFSYPISQHGVYEFYTVASDNSSNTEAAPAGADATVIANTSDNNPFTYTLVTGNESLVFPMTNALDETIAFTGATAGGTVTVSRTTPFTPPAYFATGSSSNMLGEKLIVTGSGLGTFSADLTWRYDAALVPASGITAVWKFDGGSTPSNTFAVTPAANTVTVNGLTSFSEFFAGDAAAVPVSVSAFTIE